MRSVIARPLAAWMVWSCLFAMTGCGTDPLADIASDGASLTSSEEASSAVYVLGSGSWGTYVYHGISSQSFWVDLSVRNDSYTKDVGVVWTSDGWATSHWTRAVYEGSLPDGRERWGLDVRDFGTLGWGSYPQVEFAAFATMNGTTHWSPFRNHFVYQPVTLERPIRLMSSRITWDGTTARLEGETRALRTATERRVFVRYTLDGWATWADVEASASGAEHAFSIPLAIDPQSTDSVEFAIQLVTGGQSAWDSNEGQNYRHQLAPSITTSLTNAPDYAIDGIVLLTGNASTAIPVDRVAYRVDQQPWIELDPVTDAGYSVRDGFGSAGWLRAVLETSALGGGAHTVEVKVQAGPFWRYAAPLDLGVADLLASVGSTSLAAADIGTTWDADRDPSGLLVVGGDRGVARLDASGALDLAFEAIDYGYVGDVEATSSFVYGLAASRLWRWEAATGAIDRSFGTSGVMDLSTFGFDGTPLCYASHFAATEDALFVTDSCNARLLRLALDGSFVDAISVLGDAAWATVLSPVVDGSRVWVVRSTYDGTSIADLVAIEAAPGAALAQVQSVRLDSRLSLTPQGYAVTADAFWVTSGDDLRRFGRDDGALAATWLGGNVYELEIPGALSIARRIEALADGSVEVLSVQTGTLERFASAH